MHATARSALAPFALLALGTAARAQVTLDFNGLPNPGNGRTNPQGTSVSEDGFTVSGSGLRSVAPNGGDAGFNYTGSVALYRADTGVINLTQDGGGAFTLDSIALANLFLQSRAPGGDTVTFTGQVQGGGTVSQTFTLAASDALQTFAFDASFTNLLSASLVQDGSDGLFNQFDNIVATPAAVPAPEALPLFGGGLTLGALALRRRARK